MNPDTKQMPHEEVVETKTKAFDAVFNKNVIYKGCLWLGLITIASIAVIFFYNHTGDTVKALSSINIKFILICLVMLFVDLMLGSWRNHIFIRKLNPEISHWVSFKANVANMFMGAVTPFHGGAGPGQLYVYNRHGVKVLDAFIVSLINMGATLLFMPIAGVFAIFFMNNDLDSGLIPMLLRYGFSVFFIFLLAFLLAFWKPLWVGMLLQKIAGTFGGLFPSKKVKAEKWGLTSFNNILKYQQICSKLLKENPMLFPLHLFPC